MRGIVAADESGIALRLRCAAGEHALGERGSPTRPVAAANAPAISIIARMEGIPFSRSSCG
jgi:hypothetical protein